MARQEVFLLFEHYRGIARFVAVYSSYQTAEASIYQIGSNAVEKTVNRGTEIWKSTLNIRLYELSWTIMKVGILP